MKIILLALIAATVTVFPRPAASQAIGGPDRAALEDARRQQAMAQQQEAQARIQRAREKCSANRGADCETMDGLQEWLLLDRSRAEAVLDRVAPPAGSASVGSSSLPR